MKVPANVLTDLESIRESGLTNMLDIPAVIQICEHFEFFTAGVWIGIHRSEYAQGIFEGFETE